MGYTKLKTRHVAQISVLQFLRRHRNTYYWTFTVCERLEDKCEALRRAKPFFDLVARRGGSYLAFWELQHRGAWHLHLLTDARFDVTWLRPWMMERGWGPQMFVKWVSAGNEGAVRLARYLTKYLTKSLDECPRKKAFSGSRDARAGTIGFQWTPDTNPSAYFFYYGRQLFFELYGRQPKFTEFREVMRLGYEAVEWAAVDPWSEPPG